MLVSLPSKICLRHMLNYIYNLAGPNCLLNCDQCDTKNNLQRVTCSYTTIFLSVVRMQYRFHHINVPMLPA